MVLARSLGLLVLGGWSGYVGAAPVEVRGMCAPHEGREYRVKLKTNR